MTSNLERRYRALLKVLPRWYRADREEEMVALFLEDKSEDHLEYTSPGWGEAFSTLGLAARVRMGAHGGPARTVALGDAVRTAALLSLLASVAFAGATVVNVARAMLDPLPGFVWPVWSIAAQFLPLLVLGLVLGGQRVWAKVVAGVALVPGVVSMVVSEQWLSAAFLLPWWIGFVLLCLGFHRDAPKPAGRPWGVAAGFAFVAGAGVAAVDLWMWTYYVVVGLLVVSWLVAATRVLVPGFRRP